MTTIDCAVRIDRRDEASIVVDSNESRQSKLPELGDEFEQNNRAAPVRNAAMNEIKESPQQAAGVNCLANYCFCAN